MAEYGFVNVATIRVRSGAGTPSGTVRTTVAGTTRSDQLDHRGTTQRELRLLDAGHTYKVSSTYLGKGSCRGQRTRSSSTTRWSGPARTCAAWRPGDIRSGRKSKVGGRVTSSTGVTVDGEVRVTLTNGDLEKERTVDLRGGRFTVTFGRTYQAGTWKVRATFLGDRDFKGSSESFRVKG